MIPGITIRPFVADDIGFVVSRQLSFYAREYGFTSETWKAYLTGGVEAFVNSFDDTKDCMYILEKDRRPSGCIAITHVDELTAQLRFFFVEPAVQGRGAGRMLLGRAIGFCREKPYRQVFLWTFSTLMPARHLYAGSGFRVTETRINNDWGTSVLEERWNLEL
jgi:GNAT superfamily N-acetyltransferase